MLKEFSPDIHIMTTKEVAEATGLTQVRVCQLAKSGVISGRQLGSQWIIDPSAVTVIKERVETRGRKKK